MEGGEKGKYERKNNTITISEELKNRPVTTLLHEIQHAIQKIEGFANGSSPEYWNQKIQSGLEVRKNDKRIQNAEKEYRRIFDSAPKEFKEKIREMNRATIEKDYDTVMRIQDELYESEYAELFSKLDMADFVRRYDRGEILTADELYRNTAGEIEARDAAVRMDMTADERRNTFPNIGNENTVFADVGEGFDQYSINETDDGRAVAVVDSDILSHMGIRMRGIKQKKRKRRKLQKRRCLRSKTVCR